MANLPSPYVKSRNGMPEQLANFYKLDKDLGCFVFEVQGFRPFEIEPDEWFEIKRETKVLRDQNIELMKRYEELVAEMAEKEATMKWAAEHADELLADGADPDVIERIKRIQDDLTETFEKVIREEEGDEGHEEESAASGAREPDPATENFEREIRLQAEKHGVLPGAMQDVLARAYHVFQRVDGEYVAQDSSGPVYGADGVSPLSPKEWVAGLKDSQDHLFT